MSPYTFHHGKYTLDFIEPAYVLFCSHRFSPWSKYTFAAGLQNKFSLVICEQASLVGYLIVSNVLDETEIEDICIRPEYRQRGIASLLIDRFIQNTLKTEIRHTFLEVAKTNQYAISLYKKNGFEPVGLRKDYYKIGENTIDAIVMKRLTNHNWWKN